MIYQLLYTSRAKMRFEDMDLLALLSQARIDNEAANITGLLLYENRSFVQLLEGDKVDVDRIMGKIEKDRRHEGIVTLIKEMSPFGRLFPTWRMGFRHMRYLDKTEIVGLEEVGLETVQKYIRLKPEQLAARVMSNIISNNDFS